MTIDKDPAVSIAVLFERLGHVIAKIDDLGTRMDAQTAHRDRKIDELEGRIDHLEQSVDRARWFIAGVAAGGGALGGTVATLVAQAIGA